MVLEVRKVSTLPTPGAALLVQWYKFSTGFAIPITALQSPWVLSVKCAYGEP